MSFLTGTTSPMQIQMYQNNLYYSRNNGQLSHIDLSTNAVNNNIFTFFNYNSSVFAMYNTYVYYMHINGSIAMGQLINNTFTLISNSAYSSTDPGFVAALINPSRTAYYSMNVSNSYLYVSYSGYDHPKAGIIRAKINPDGTLTNVNPAFIQLSANQSAKSIRATTTNVYMIIGDTISNYTIDGTLVSTNWSNASLSYPQSIEIYGPYMYVGDANTIQQINLADGTIHNATWVNYNNAYFNSLYVYNDTLVAAVNTYNLINKYTLPPLPIINLCFIGETPIMTDQGTFPICQITEKHTIQQNP